MKMPETQDIYTLDLGDTLEEALANANSMRTRTFLCQAVQEHAIIIMLNEMTTL